MSNLTWRWLWVFGIAFVLFAIYAIAKAYFSEER